MASEECIKRVRDYMFVLKGSGAPHQQTIASDIEAVLNALGDINVVILERDTAIANATAAIDARDEARAEVTKLTEMLDKATNPNVPVFDFSKGTLNLSPVMEVSKLSEYITRKSDDGGSTFESVTDEFVEPTREFDEKASNGGTIADAGSSPDEAPASPEPEKKD